MEDRSKKGLKSYMEAEKKAVKKLFKVVKPLPKREVEDEKECED